MKYLLAPLALVLSVVAGWFVYQHSLQHARPAAKSRDVAPPAVEITRVLEREIEDQVLLIGSLEANFDVSVRSRVRGYITRLPFDVGDFVDPAAADGTAIPLVELDNAANLEAVAYAEAALRVATARLASRNAAVVLARKLVERQARLIDSGAITAQEREQREAELEIAEAEYELQQAAVSQAESELKRAQLDLADTRILPTQPGFVAERFVDVGDLANPDDLLLRMVDLSRVRTVVHVVEKEYPRVEPGQRAVVRVDAFPGEEFAGVVVRKAPVLALDTRTASVQIEIDNPKFRLKPGMHARVSLNYSALRIAHVVPVSAMVTDGGQPAVYVVTGNPPVATLKRVQTGVVSREWVEVVSGLQADEQVVTLGGHELASGMQVVPFESDRLDESNIAGRHDVLTGG